MPVPSSRPLFGRTRVTHHRYDGESSNRPVVEALDERSGSADGIAQARVQQPLSRPGERPIVTARVPRTPSRARGVDYGCFAEPEIHSRADHCLGMTTMAMIAIEATIVSTAMPQIVADLGGLRLYSWVFSSFLLAQTAMTVVFGNLADIYGRKPVMLVGIAIFLLGSLLAGFAWSMPAMIGCRLIQGVGAGAMQPVAMTIVADLYPARERGKVQGYLASVWAIAAVVGPSWADSSSARCHGPGSSGSIFPSGLRPRPASSCSSRNIQDMSAARSTWGAPPRSQSPLRPC